MKHIHNAVSVRLYSNNIFLQSYKFTESFTGRESDYQSYICDRESNKIYFITNMLNFTLSN